MASFSPEITLQDIQKSAQHANLGLARFLLVARLAVTKHTVRDMPSAPLNEHPAAAAASPNPDLETAAQPAVAASRNPQQTAAADSPEPNLETVAQPAAAANMHRVTGTFADPSHESTFSAGLFRMACPTHVLLMALVLPYSFCSALVEPDMRAPRAAPHRPAETAWALVLDSSVELTHFGSDTLCHFHAALVLLV